MYRRAGGHGQTDRRRLLRSWQRKALLTTYLACNSTRLTDNRRFPKPYLRYILETLRTNDKRPLDRVLLNAYPTPKHVSGQRSIRSKMKKLAHQLMYYVTSSERPVANVHMPSPYEQRRVLNGNVVDDVLMIPVDGEDSLGLKDGEVTIRMCTSTDLRSKFPSQFVMRIEYTRNPTSILYGFALLSTTYATIPFKGFSGTLGGIDVDRGICTFKVTQEDDKVLTLKVFNRPILSYETDVSVAHVTPTSPRLPSHMISGSNITGNAWVYRRETIFKTDGGVSKLQPRRASTWERVRMLPLRGPFGARATRRKSVCVAPRGVRRSGG